MHKSILVCLYAPTMWNEKKITFVDNVVYDIMLICTFTNYLFMWTAVI